jgi:hypothetical protein
LKTTTNGDKEIRQVRDGGEIRVVIGAPVGEDIRFRVGDTVGGRNVAVRATAFSGKQGQWDGQSAAVPTPFSEARKMVIAALCRILRNR